MSSNQRERLFGAMAHALACHGYGATSVAELISLAGVSRATFYEHFSGKEECFLAAYDEIAARTEVTILDAYRGCADPRGRLGAALDAFTALACSEPRALALMLLYALGAGPRALERRNDTLVALERRIVSSRDGTPASGPADLTVRVVLGGIREVAATRLRQGRGDELPGLAGELTMWARSYPQAPPLDLAPTPPNRATLQSGSSMRQDRSKEPLPSGRHALPRQFVINNQRERIVDAVAEIIAETGYAGLTVPAISKRASVSHQTFYEFYETKHNAFLGAQKVGMHQALLVASQAYETHKEDWPTAVAEGLDALLLYLASEPAHARLSLIDTLAAGPEALEIREAGLRGFASFLRPGCDHAPHGQTVASVAAEAIAGGIWQVLHHHVASQRIEELPRIAPQLSYMALTPFLGAEIAAQIASRRPASRPLTFHQACAL